MEVDKAVLVQDSGFSCSCIFRCAAQAKASATKGNSVGIYGLRLIDFPRPLDTLTWVRRRQQILSMLVESIPVGTARSVPKSAASRGNEYGPCPFLREAYQYRGAA